MMDNEEEERKAESEAKEVDQRKKHNEWPERIHRRKAEGEKRLCNLIIFVPVLPASLTYRGSVVL
jgi:hypothetical protein